jgi:hypothetical protein
VRREVRDGHVSNVRLTLVQELHLAPVIVEPGHPEALAGELRDQRQTDVTDADHDDPGTFLGESLK